MNSAEGKNWTDNCVQLTTPKSNEIPFQIPSWMEGIPKRHGLIINDSGNWGIYDGYNGKRLAFNQDRTILEMRFNAGLITKVNDAGIKSLQEVNIEALDEFVSPVKLRKVRATTNEKVDEVLNTQNVAQMVNLLVKMVRKTKIRGSVSTALNLLTIDLTQFEDNSQT